MELRKRTRTATAKVLENKYIEAEISTPRKTRKARWAAPGLPEGGNNNPAEAGMEADRSPKLEEIGDAGPVGSSSGAEGSQGQKEKVHAVDVAAADGQPHEDERINKKRRKVGTASQESERETQGTITGPGNGNKDQQAGIPETTEADGEPLVTRYGEGSVDLSSLDDQSQAIASPNGLEAGMFLSGVELPIQLNKRKDIHTGSGAENGSKTLSAELTPKRPRRSAFGEGTANDMGGGQGSPAKRATNGKGRAIKASPAKPGVVAPESPSRRRTKVTYKELSSEEEGDEPTPVSARGSSPPKASASRSNRRGKAGVSTKQAVVEQLAPRARRGRKGIWDKEVLLTSKRSRLAKAADLSVCSNSASNLFLQANIYRMSSILQLGASFHLKSKKIVLPFFPPSIRCTIHRTPVTLMATPMVMQALARIFLNPTRSSRTPLWSFKMI